MINRLEILAISDNPKQLREALEMVFMGDEFTLKRGAIYNEALTSSESVVCDTARALKFIDDVDASGFEETISSVEEELFSDSSDDEFIDFLSEEVAAQSPQETLGWLTDQNADLWRDAVPVILGDWASSEPEAVGEWIQTIESGPFRDRAIAEYIPTLAKQDRASVEYLVSQIQDEDILQEAKIRAGLIDLSSPTQALNK